MLRGYERYKCVICEKKCFKNVALYIYFSPKYHNCCSNECLTKHFKKEDRARIKAKAKNEAEFITKVAKEVIKLQKEV